MAHPHRRQGRGKGQTRPRHGTRTRWPTGSQFLTKDLLRFRMVDICREGRGWRPAPQNRPKVHPTSAGGNWGWGRGGEKAPVKLLAAWAARAGKGTKRRPNRVRAFVEDPKTGTACNAGPPPYRAAWSLSSVDGESPHPWPGANPVWPEHWECSPHAPVTFVCSAPPSPQHDWTSEPKQETISACLCQGGN